MKSQTKRKIIKIGLIAGAALLIALGIAIYIVINILLGAGYGAISHFQAHEVIEQHAIPIEEPIPLYAESRVSL